MRTYQKHQRFCQKKLPYETAARKNRAKPKSMQALAENNTIKHRREKETLIAAKKHQSNTRLPARMFTSYANFMQVNKGTPRLGNNIDPSRASIIRSFDGVP